MGPDLWHWNGTRPQCRAREVAGFSSGSCCRKKSATRRSGQMKRLAHICVLVTALLLLMGADNSETARINSVGGKIMCSCGCAQMLLKCNHIGCPNSDQMIRDLKANVQSHPKDEDVLQWFRENWGITAVVEPASHGFE